MSRPVILMEVIVTAAIVHPAAPSGEIILGMASVMMHAMWPNAGLTEAIVNLLDPPHCIQHFQHIQPESLREKPLDKNIHNPSLAWCV